MITSGTRDTYLFKSLVEEAIASSQLKGASTTRRVAKAMIQEGREPRDHNERMIYNNYQAMLYVRRVLDQPFTPSIVLELRRILTEGMLDDSSAAGRLRTAEEAEEIHVTDEIGTVLHILPHPASINSACSYAPSMGSTSTSRGRPGSSARPTN